MFKQFCMETTMGGFRELHDARSKVLKIFWLLVLIIGIGMTCFQIYSLTDNYTSTPTKTQIVVLPPNVEIRYPPLTVVFLHFSYWINVTKLKQFDFDAETFLYAMSYIQEIHSTLNFDPTQVNIKLKNIMHRNGIANLYDLIVKLLVDQPPAIPGKNFTHFMTNSKWPIYVLNIESEMKSPEHKDPTFKAHRIRLKLFTNFEFSEFNQQFIRYFNYSLSDDYAQFYEQLIVGQLYMTVKNPSSNLPFLVFPSGSKVATYVEPSSANYEFRMKGTFYKWIPTSEGNCRDTTDILFYPDCQLKCNTQFKLFWDNTTNLYFLSNITESPPIKSSFVDSELMGNISKGYNWTDYALCMDDCNSGCNQWKYDVSQIIMPKEVVTDSTSNYTLSMISVYFEDRENMLMISLLPSVTWEEALADVGGLLGLWLGGSIISFVQIVYLFVCIPLEKWIQSRNSAVSHKVKLSSVSSNENITKATAEEYEMKRVQFANEVGNTIKPRERVNEDIRNELSKEMEQIKTSMNLLQQKMHGLENKLTTTA